MGAPGRTVPPDPRASHLLLSVEGLTTAFPAGERLVPVVDDVTFGIGRGETLALVGESGSGKSLTALSILRLVPAPGRIARGRVLFEGRDLGGLTEQEMRRVRGARIALVPQEPMTALTPVLTVGRQIAETIVAHGIAGWGEARVRALELLDAVGIDDPARRARDYPHQLSGGQRQRALIAIALACRPTLLIADEPTTALDVTVQAQVLELLRSLRRQFELSILLITHDLGVVAQTADRLAVMYAGRIVEQGSVRDLLREPAHPYTRGLLASIPGAHAGARLRAIPGSVPRSGEAPGGCPFAPRCEARFTPCDTTAPVATTVGDDHVAWCHLHGGAPVTPAPVLVKPPA